MRRRRTRFENMTTAQREAHRQRRIARTWLEAVAWGLAEVMKQTSDREDCDAVRFLIDCHMVEAISEYEKADEKCDNAMKKRRPAKKKAAA
jgi:hypothetical protein